MSLAISFPLEQSSSRMTANLLLIDDNAVQAATRQTILRRAGYFVIAALNPARVLEQIQSGDLPEEIGLVITSITLLSGKRVFWYLGIVTSVVGLVVAVVGATVH